jgi:hypothetical protein
VKILKGIYRDGEDFINDFCNQHDREIMRVFPPMTEPEYTKIIIDFYSSRKLLGLVTKHMDKIFSLNH